MPKLQAACTMTAGDGMKVHTRSASAAEGQEAVLEFILLNHPLDCPVCDKGGECPLQDLTYRYGPGNTRFHLNKRTYEKPLAISPLIALDRERCILCYRCTRFSQDVAEDEQLVARERGATSVIATFEEQPYRGRFSGNVIELCPVGALTSTAVPLQGAALGDQRHPQRVRHSARRAATPGRRVREGGVRRVLSRNHPERRRGLAVRQGPLRPRATWAPATATCRAWCAARAGSSPPRAEQLAETIARRLRHHATPPRPRVDRRRGLGRADATRRRYAWAELVRAAGGGALVSTGFAARATGTRSRPTRARIADLDHADLIVVVGRARGRRCGRRARAARAPGRAPRSAPAARGQRRRRPRPHRRRAHRRPATIGGRAARRRAPGPDRDRARGAWPTAAATAHAAGLADGPGGVLAVPEGPNERGLHALGYRDDAAEVLRRAEDGTLQMLVVLGDADPLSRFAEPERWEAALQRCESVVASSLFPTPTALWAHVILPATSALEKDGTITNLEGRTQRLRAVLPPPDGVAPELAVLAAAGRHLELELASSPVAAFAPRGGGRSAVRRADLRDDRPARPAPSARPPAPAAAPAPAPPARRPAAGRDGLHAVGRRPLFSGAAVARTERLAFQRSDEIVLARADAQRLGIAEGERVTVRHAGGATTGRCAPLAHARARRRPLRLGRRAGRRPVQHRGGRADARRRTRHA